MREGERVGEKVGEVGRVKEKERDREGVEGGKGERKEGITGTGRFKLHFLFLKLMLNTRQVTMSPAVIVVSIPRTTTTATTVLVTFSGVPSGGIPSAVSNHDVSDHLVILHLGLINKKSDSVL